MLSWPCDPPGCSGTAFSEKHTCFDCDQRFCSIHYAEPGHACKGMTEARIEEWHKHNSCRSFWQRQTLLTLLRRHFASILLAAEALRYPHKASITLPTGTDDFLRGEINVHLPIDFEDGVRWYARVKLLRLDSPSRAVMRMFMESEAVTMQLLHEAGCTVPMAYFAPIEYAELDSDLDYFFVEHIGGEPCDVLIGYGADQANAHALVEDYAKSQVALSSLTFQAIGSLVPTVPYSDNDGIPATTTIANRISTSDASAQLGPLYNRLIMQDGSPPFFPGPFTCARDKWLAIVDAALPLIRDGLLDTEQPLYTYLAHLEIRHMIANDPVMAVVGDCFIQHVDDYCSNFMQDDQGRLTGIIDWEWASVASKDEAFAAPKALIDSREIAEGITDLGELEEVLAAEYELLGRSDLAECVRRGRRYHALRFALEEALWPSVLRSLMVLFGYMELAGPIAPKNEEEEESWLTTWMEGAKLRFAEDEGYRASVARLGDDELKKGG